MRFLYVLETCRGSAPPRKVQKVRSCQTVRISALKAGRHRRECIHGTLCARCLPFDFDTSARAAAKPPVFKQ